MLCLEIINNLTKSASGTIIYYITVFIGLAGVN